eukprot:ctg_2298.g504
MDSESCTRRRGNGRRSQATTNVTSRGRRAAHAASAGLGDAGGGASHARQRAGAVSAVFVCVHGADSARCAQPGVFPAARSVQRIRRPLLPGGQRRALHSVRQHLAGNITAGAHLLSDEHWLRLWRARLSGGAAGADGPAVAIPLPVPHQLVGARAIRAAILAGSAVDGSVRNAADRPRRRRGLLAGVLAAGGSRRPRAAAGGLRGSPHPGGRSSRPTGGRVSQSRRQVRRHRP